MKLHGSIPLVRKSQVATEFGEPVIWIKDETLETGETYPPALRAFAKQTLLR